MKLHLHQRLLLFTATGFVAAFLVTGLGLTSIAAAALPVVEQSGKTTLEATEEATPYSDNGGVIVPQTSAVPPGGIVSLPRALATETKTPTLVLTPAVGGEITKYNDIALPVLAGLTIGLVIISALLLLRKGKKA